MDQRIKYRIFRYLNAAGFSPLAEIDFFPFFSSYADLINALDLIKA